MQNGNDDIELFLANFGWPVLPFTLPTLPTWVPDVTIPPSITNKIDETACALLFKKIPKWVIDGVCECAPAVDSKAAMVGD